MPPIGLVEAGWKRPMNLNEIYQIDQYIDTFALGHYARVLSATDLRTGHNVAFKVMRPEHLVNDGEPRWEFKAFINEAQILRILEANPIPNTLIDCGFLSSIAEAPGEGEIASFGQNVLAFSTEMHEYALEGWRPYLAIEPLPRMDNLFYAMRSSTGSQNGPVRRRLPSEEGITLALQFANLLKMAHQNTIVYLDHKLEHLYWDGQHLRVIDFNSSQRLTGGAGDSQQYAKDVHNMCVGVLYPLFTGMSPQQTTLRPQPGGREDVEARYMDITELDFMMAPELSRSLQGLLQAGAALEIRTIGEFIEELEMVASLHGRDFPHASTRPESRSARDRMRQGLSLLREGEEHIREARDIFRDTLIIDGISEDLEDELRRLVKSVNEMLNHRVIP
ncbi:MAG: hypothetical protein KC546_09620 [Anaerolineae bacterium]|nr:hypothetical protein [Anaerolineae bacterium]MCA9892221.1 hypothetical protein [Anaerolineae bacterium]MCB9460877.1 hypothetical protein [Anaerolineaceae bacterium]